MKDVARRMPLLVGLLLTMCLLPVVARAADAPPPGSPTPLAEALKTALYDSQSTQVQGRRSTNGCTRMVQWTVEFPRPARMSLRPQSTGPVEGFSDMEYRRGDALKWLSEMQNLRADVATYLRILLDPQVTGGAKLTLAATSVSTATAWQEEKLDCSLKSSRLDTCNPGAAEDSTKKRGWATELEPLFKGEVPKPACVAVDAGGTIVHKGRLNLDGMSGAIWDQDFAYTTGVDVGFVREVWIPDTEKPRLIDDARRWEVSLGKSDRTLTDFDTVSVRITDACVLNEQYQKIAPPRWTPHLYAGYVFGDTFHHGTVGLTTSISRNPTSNWRLYVGKTSGGNGLTVGVLLNKGFEDVVGLAKPSD